MYHQDVAARDEQKKGRRNLGCRGFTIFFFASWVREEGRSKATGRRATREERMTRTAHHREETSQRKSEQKQKSKKRRKPRHEGADEAHNRESNQTHVLTKGASKTERLSGS